MEEASRMIDLLLEKLGHPPGCSLNFPALILTCSVHDVFTSKKSPTMEVKVNDYSLVVGCSRCKGRHDGCVCSVSVVSAERCG